MAGTQKLQVLFLYHMWVCVPFAAAWAVAPHRVGLVQADSTIAATRYVFGVAGAYLLARTILVLRGCGDRLRMLWPLADIAFISAAIYFRRSPSDSWIFMLYLFPIIEAAATLRARWSFFVAALAIVSCLISSGSQGLQALHYASGLFRFAYLLVMASLLTALGLKLARTYRELSVSEYRNELAAEMHDGIQQYLAAICMRLDLAESLLLTDPERAARVAVEQRSLAGKAVDELRLMVRRMRAQSGDSTSLARSLKDCVDFWADRCDFPVDLRVAGVEIRLSPKAQHAVLRIVQEALNNAAKHSEATKVLVDLRFEPHKVSCRVSDNGRGFDLRYLDRECDGGGFGMHTMRNRAAELGGACEVDSRPGEGTTVSVTVPCK